SFSAWQNTHRLAVGNAETKCMLLFSAGKMKVPSSNPRSDGLRIARDHEQTHRQNGSSEWPLNRHAGALPYLRRSAELFRSFTKNRFSMSIMPMYPSASLDVPSSV